MNPTAITSDRLDLPPMSADAVQALIDGDAAHLTALTGAAFPLPLQPPPLTADALPFFRDRLRDDPAIAPWWFRLIVRRDTGQAVGSVGLGGRPDDAGVVLAGYSVYPEHQGQGIASEAFAALVAWALAQPGVNRVRATIPPWNIPSLRVAAKAGLAAVATEQDQEVGEVQVWEIARGL
jgi:RimJ/RimL family protein N-acetyltransferase